MPSRSALNLWLLIPIWVALIIIGAVMGFDPVMDRLENEKDAREAAFYEWIGK